MLPSTSSTTSWGLLASALRKSLDWSSWPNQYLGRRDLLISFSFLFIVSNGRDYLHDRSTHEKVLLHRIMDAAAYIRKHREMIQRASKLLFVTSEAAHWKPWRTFWTVIRYSYLVKCSSKFMWLALSLSFPARTLKQPQLRNSWKYDQRCGSIYYTKLSPESIPDVLRSGCETLCIGNATGLERSFRLMTTICLEVSRSSCQK
jgi:hypothetical protein